MRLPRDWLGPRDELVPFGPSAYRDRPEVDQHLSEVGSPSLTQDDFWGGDLDAVPRPLIGPKPEDGFSLRRGAAGGSEVDGGDARATGRDQTRGQSRWSGLRRPGVGWAVPPPLPSIHLGLVSPALRRRVGVVGILAAVVVGATVLGLNLIAPSHHASRSSQIAAVSPSTDGLIAPPPHVAPLRALLASKGDAVASRARTRRIPRSSLRSSSHRAAHQSGHVTYVARVTPAQSYRPAPTQYVGTTTSTDTSPTAGQSATTARQTSSAAAGPTGLGSQVGTDCNPKCR